MPSYVLLLILYLSFTVIVFIYYTLNFFRSQRQGSGNPPSLKNGLVRVVRDFQRRVFFYVFVGMGGSRFARLGREFVGGEVACVNLGCFEWVVDVSCSGGYALWFFGLVGVLCFGLLRQG